LGNTLFDLGQIEAALMCFSRVLTVDPGNIMAMNDMGVVYAATNRTDEATALFRRVRDIEPGNAAAQDNLALIAAKKNTLEAEYDQAVKNRGADPGHPEKQLRVAALAAALGRDAEAESLFSAVLETAPNHPMALAGLGALSQARGRYGDAAVFYARLADNHQELRGEAYYALACLSVLEQRLDDGLSFLKRAADAGFTDWHRLAVDPRLEQIRGEPGFQAFMARVGLATPTED
jgi:tetratricopeptide (TPR) repeat protein